ncbi:hypothetical protein B0H17DRAFT_1195753 [Mycena rosella]|uniref:Uncharacterized protein n=1 Tax=Mycena rosella TaxID=1033263 RepID=A0AAD7GQN0_MYCRO|nr:hypothetical protein B0H17DRAFT_1195753 [Mycena rosella]
MQSFTIPISVSNRTQRTLKLVGCGIKSILTTKVSGRLVIRKKASVNGFGAVGILPWGVTAEPAPPPILQNVDNRSVVPAAVKVEDLHAQLVSHGIKVRDFAYPANRVGHSKPVDPRPMAFVQEAESDKDIPLTPEETPMPCVSATGTEPHPAMLPLPKCKWRGSFKIPTLTRPYRAVYATHRIPSWFDQAAAVVEVEYRLSQNPRTVPIIGLTTRRLLTLSPDLVDLTRYAEMDLEELRRYDRRLVWGLLHGVEPYPWRAVHRRNWVPSAKTRAKMLKHLAGLWREGDASMQKEYLHRLLTERAEDDAWEDEQLRRCTRENDELNLDMSEEAQAARSEFDQIDPFGTTLRQCLEIWAQRMQSDEASVRYAENVRMLEKMRAFDAAQLSGGEAHKDAPVYDDEEMPDALPVPRGWPNTQIAPFPLWGPKAPYDGAAYRAATAPPTDKDLHAYLAELVPTPAPSPASDPSSRPPPEDYFIYASQMAFPSPFVYRNQKGCYVYLSAVSDEIIGEVDIKAPFAEEPDTDADSREAEMEAAAGVSAGSDTVAESVDAPLARKRGIEEVDAADAVEEPRAKRARNDRPHDPSLSNVNNYMQEPTPICVVGASGLIGRRHTQHCLDEPLVSLACIVDPAPAGEALAAAHGVPYFASLDAMLTSAVRVRGAILATPNGTHVELGEQLLRAGVHTLVEKPMATDSEGARRLVAAAAEVGCKLLVGHHRRFNPHVVAAKRLLDEGTLGRVLAVQGLWTALKPAAYFEGPTAWRAEAESGGVVLINLVHDLDLLRYLLGDIVRVYCERGVSTRGAPAEETGALTMAFRSGTVGTFVFSDAVASPHSFEAATGENPMIPYKGENVYTFLGTRGTASFPELKAHHYANANGDWTSEFLTDAVPEVDAVPPFTRQLQHFTRVCRGEEEAKCSGLDALKTIIVVEAVKESMKTGRVIEMIDL